MTVAEAGPPEEAMAGVGAAGTPVVMDTKLIKGPGNFDGDKKKWKRWSAKLDGYIAGVSQNLLRVMQLAAARRIAAAR